MAYLKTCMYLLFSTFLVPLCAEMMKTMPYIIYQLVWELIGKFCAKSVLWFFEIFGNRAMPTIMIESNKKNRILTRLMWTPYLIRERAILFHSIHTIDIYIYLYISTVRLIPDIVSICHARDISTDIANTKTRIVRDMIVLACTSTYYSNICTWVCYIFYCTRSEWVVHNLSVNFTQYT